MRCGIWFLFFILFWSLYVAGQQERVHVQRPDDTRIVVRR